MLAVIGGTGFSSLAGLSDGHLETFKTAFGDAVMERGTLSGVPILFCSRHGHPPSIPPHKINYRANIQALADAGVTEIIAVTAVGSVDPMLDAGDLVVPDQIIDYTWGREHTFFPDQIHHIEFTHPYDSELRNALLQCLEKVEATLHHHGTYGCTQGPRLETAAEIVRLRRDGCTIVGMTAMPEAALAREKDIAYAGVSVVVNPGAGIDDQEIDLDAIAVPMQKGMTQVANCLKQFVANR